MSIVGKSVRIAEGKAVGVARRLFVSVSEVSVLFTVASWALVLVFGLVIPRVFTPDKSIHQMIALLAAVLVPDGLAAWWISKRLQRDRSRNDALRAATAFAISAPVVLGVANLFGELVGGYIEAIFGSRFILPSIGTFVIILMIFIPSSVVMWALHPSGGVGPVPESDQNEHC